MDDGCGCGWELPEPESENSDCAPLSMGACGWELPEPEPEADEWVAALAAVISSDVRPPSADSGDERVAILHAEGSHGRYLPTPYSHS